MRVCVLCERELFFTRKAQKQMVKETNLQSREANFGFHQLFFLLCDKTIAAVRPHMCLVLICALWFASNSSLIGVVLFTLPVRQKQECFQRAIAFNCDVPSYSMSVPQRHGVINNEKVTAGGKKKHQQDVAHVIKSRLTLVSYRRVKVPILNVFT